MVKIKNNKSKEWKKIEGLPFYYERGNENKQESVQVVYANRAKKWEVLIWFKSGNADEYMFKTKSQALKFAEEYMRTH